MANAQGSFEVTAWGEEQLEELEGGGNVTRAWGGQTYRGDLKGDGGASSGTLTVVEGSGTGDLSGFRGAGTFRAPGGSNASYELDYELE